MDEKKTVESLEELFAAGDAWLRKYGMVTSIAHNAIVANLYVNFPKVRYLEYFLPQDTTRRKVWVRLYVPFWKLLFTNRDKMIDQVIDFLKEYLDGYDIKVELKRYKKGVEKNDEIPQNAVDHVKPDVPAGDVDVPQPAAGSPTPDPIAADAASEAGSNDSGSPPSSEPGAGSEPPVPDSSDSGESKPSS